MRTRLAAVLGTCALVGLSGCGSDLSPDVHPGSAAVVGDHQISFDAVDDGADAYCESMLEVPNRGWEARPMASLRSEYLDALVDEELAKAYVEATGLDVADTVEAQQQSIESQIADPQLGLSSDAQATLREFFSHVVYAQSVQHTVGSEQASQSSGQLTDEQILDNGEQAIRDWADKADVDVSVDPRFDLAGDGSSQLSVAVSDLARVPLDPQASQEDADAYLASLPDSQKCA